MWHIVLLQFMVTGTFAAYFMSLMVTSLTSPVHYTHSESDEVLKLLLGQLEVGWLLPTVFSVSDFVPLSEHVWLVTSLTWLALLCVLQTCLSGLCADTSFFWFILKVLSSVRFYWVIRFWIQKLVVSTSSCCVVTNETVPCFGNLHAFNHDEKTESLRLSSMFY